MHELGVKTWVIFLDQIPVCGIHVGDPLKIQFLGKPVLVG